MKNILVTGGAGYIGSHTCVELLQAGYGVIVLDNLKNSSEQSLREARDITNTSPQKLKFIQGSVLDMNILLNIFESHNIASVIHFAGLKSINDSIRHPISYYETNVVGMLNVIETMRFYDVDNFVFSSSAAVYGLPDNLPIDEIQAANRATTPYGKSKEMCEQILLDVANAYPTIDIGILRYFNPVGAHPSGQIGEDSREIPNNLMPYITQVAEGKLEELKIFGNDYDTEDGTGVRDYIHVVDLAKGHLAMLTKLETGLTTNTPLTINLGTGKGCSVLNLIQTFCAVTGTKVPYKIVKRRKGDIGECYADAMLAKRALGWEATYTIERMCADAWNWQSKNPNGFKK